MEINAEVNKIFGQEMAKLFAATISEDEMYKKAKAVWNDMNRSAYNRDSEINAFIKNAFKDELKDEINKITSSDVFKEYISSMAQDIVDEIVKKTKEKMIEDVSNRLACIATGKPDRGLYSYIEDAVAQSIMKMR